MTRFKKSGFLALLAVVVLLQLSQFCQAQDIYVLPVVGGKNAKGEDNGYLISARSGIEKVREVFQANVPKENLILFGSDGWGSQGEQPLTLSGPKMLNAIRTCPAGSNDTIVVYWIGHGYGDNNTEHHFLQMAKLDFCPF